MKSTGTRLSNALLGYFILVIALLTLNPFYLARPDRIQFTFYSDLSNLIANILLFLPIGYFYRLATGKRGALLLGFVFSASIEVTQLFIPARTPSMVDVLANTAGAGLGTILYRSISARITLSENMAGKLRLETPLMGLIYLLIPLLWMNSLTINREPSRRILTTLLGICGAIIWSELFRHWWKVVENRIIVYASLASSI